MKSSPGDRCGASYGGTLMRFAKDPSYSYLQRGDAICLRLRIVGPGAHRFEIVLAPASSSFVSCWRTTRRLLSLRPLLPCSSQTIFPTSRPWSQLGTPALPASMASAAGILVSPNSKGYTAIPPFHTFRSSSSNGDIQNYGRGKSLYDYSSFAV